MGYYAGLDIGGTTARMKLEDENGIFIGEFYGAGGTMNTDGYEKCHEKYRNFILPVLEKNQLKAEDCTKICIAASGIDSPRQEAECRRSFESMGFLPDRIQVYNDCEVFLHTSSNPAIVLICGTGSIAFARDISGKIIRCGGWGHLLSDEGSGYHIGLKVIREVANHIDGRINCPVLHRLFTEKSGLTTLAEINAFINSNVMEKDAIAAYAPLAEEACELGDESGLKILRECSDELFDLVRDIYHKAEFDRCRDDKTVKIWFWGSVLLKNKIVASELRKLLLEEFCDIEIGIPDKTALEIALELSKHSK